MENGRTYIPLRIVITALGGDVEWDRYMSGAAVTSPGAAHDASDLYWLSRIIHAEAQGEPLTGKTAVGSSGPQPGGEPRLPRHHPRSDFDPGQRRAVPAHGQRRYFQHALGKIPEAARQALDGAQPVGASLYFFAPAQSQGSWITANRVYYTTIGGHRFYL